MNAKRFLVISFIVTLLLLVSCKADISKNEPKYGSLCLNADTPKTIEPIIVDLTCASYKAIGVHSDGVHLFEQTFTEKTVTIGQLLVGSWSVYVEGYNSDGVLVARSSALSLTIQKAQTTNASFQLGYLTEGNGTLGLTVKVPSSESQVAKIQISVINSSAHQDVLGIVKPASAVDGYYEFAISKQYPAGSYQIRVMALDSTDKTIGEEFIGYARVYANLTSEETWISQMIGLTRVATPIISPASGIIESTTEISISCVTEGADIYYTIDGTNPTATNQSLKYTGPFTIDQSRTIKAIAVKGNLENSYIAIAEYEIAMKMAFVDPIHYSLEIDVPDDWEEGISVISGVCANLNARLTPDNDTAVYSWYLDGYPAMYDNGVEVGNSSLIRLGTSGEYNLELYQGNHTIVCVCQIGSTVLSKNYNVSVSNSGTAGYAGINYAVGDIGPSGGYIIYDKGACSEGWRYLEAAPADLRVVDGIPTIDSAANGYSSAPETYIFGQYRASDGGDNLYVNGTTSYNAADCTNPAIGAGKTNTQLLVGSMGDEAYSSILGSGKTPNYAARLCDILTYTVNGITYEDWFLPSIDELNLMYVNCPGCLASNTCSYVWSSSEYLSNAAQAWAICVDGDQGENVKHFFLR